MLTWDFPYRLGGPVLAWELYRGQLRWSLRILVVSFLTFTFVQFMVNGYSDWSAKEQSISLSGAIQRLSPNEIRQIRNTARLEYATHYLGRFFPLQLLLLLLITPALVTGALGQEKENDTLIALFCTELSDAEIVRGKTLGRFWIVLRFTTVRLLVE